jgi:hypothetical protein
MAGDVHACLVTGRIRPPCGKRPSLRRQRHRTYFTTFEVPDARFRLVAGRPYGLQRPLIASGWLPTGQPGPMHLHADDEVLCAS